MCATRISCANHLQPGSIEWRAMEGSRRLGADTHTGIKFLHGPLVRGKDGHLTTSRGLAVSAGCESKETSWWKVDDPPLRAAAGVRRRCRTPKRLSPFDLRPSVEAGKQNVEHILPTALTWGLRQRPSNSSVQGKRTAISNQPRSWLVVTTRFSLDRLALTSFLTLLPRLNARF